MTIKETLTTLPQYILPHHALSRMMSRLTHCENKAWKNLMIKQIIRHYGVNMDEALIQDIEAFKNFNHFFTRELKPGVRQQTWENGAIACPADGQVSQAGTIAAGRIFQAKGKEFTATELLGGDSARAEPFNNGHFTTIYLSPKDYHRLHMPLAGSLREMVHIPGRLFSVNTTTTNSVPGLFARNERVAAIFDTEAGPMALILVGAIFVSSIEIVWHGVVSPPTIESVRSWQYRDDPPQLAKGEEMGRFNMGSTIIVLFSENQMTWNEDLRSGQTVKLGQAIGTVKS
uniref:archaetidylserine decarboxylase n=1 Tax=Methylicorpusculum sp. TaxID=2713644 RepID=UPI00271CF646|nr:archaetidylserine decarboxylase [Methylicorpusculum sp.]MDO8844793.1 archaetidylserine decarboxylase [Methylicorpusculum sp.]